MLSLLIQSTSTRISSPAFTDARSWGSPSNFPRTLTLAARRHSPPTEMGEYPYFPWDCKVLTRTSIALFMSAALALSPVGGARVLSQAASYKYKPPADRQQEEQRTETRAARGCPQAPEASLKLLAPADHVARTAERHPTFLFYWSGPAPQIVRVSVTESGVARPIFDRRYEVHQPGWLAVSLPPSSPGLEREATYYLTFGLLCRPDKVAASAYSRIAIEKVKLPTAVGGKLERGGIDSDRAGELAQWGIWYDAVAASYRAARSQPSQMGAFEGLVRQVERGGRL